MLSKATNIRRDIKKVHQVYDSMHFLKFKKTCYQIQLMASLSQASRLNPIRQFRSLISSNLAK